MIIIYIYSILANRMHNDMLFWADYIRKVEKQKQQKSKTENWPSVKSLDEDGDPGSKTKKIK